MADGHWEGWEGGEGVKVRIIYTLHAHSLVVSFSSLIELGSGC